ncbi:MAG: TRAP transporter substrate-binding protein DctP [Desulfarculaceae bacterium]|jgi:TRAP-type C4-dicarboxylate transport system substrate-binding protein
MKKLTLLAILSLLVALALSLSLPGVALAKKWKAGGVAAPKTLDDDTLVKWCELVKKKTGGKIVIDEFPGEQLGPYRDMFDNVVRGTQESGLLPLSPEFDKRLQAGYTIYLADTWAEGRKVYGPGGWMFKLLEPVFLELGVKPLGFYFMGLDGFACTKGPIVLPSDVKKLGIKVRTWNPADRLFFQEMGAQTVDIAFSELFTSLQTGVAHAQDNAPLITYEHLRDVTKYYTDTNHLFEPLVLIVNKKLWDKQTPAVKKALQAAADEALGWGNSKAEQTAEDYFKKMTAYGIKVTRLTPAQRAEWKKYGIKSWTKFEEVIGKETMDVIRKNIKK